MEPHNPRRALRAAVMPLFLCVLFIGQTAYAGCLNCGFATTSRSVETEENDETYDSGESTRTYGGSTRTKIRRLGSDVVNDLIIPILFGVSLRDLWPNFGDPRGGGTRSHEGLDILAPEGTPIISPTRAVVTRTGRGSSAGLYVSTANPGGESFVYMHLDEIADGVSTGDELNVGDLIGYVGDTGNANGGPAHLHFEIRKGRRAYDPFDRITKEVTLENKIRYLERILKEHDDDLELAEFLVEHFEPEFIQASLQQLDLPSGIARVLPSVHDITGIAAHDLTVGDEGADVSVLQSILIAENFLDIAAPTGIFGPLTQSALRAYQTAHGIVPATGYFGPATRTALRNGTTATAPRETARTTDTDGVTADEIIRIFLALGIIPSEKEDAARAALTSLDPA